MYYLSLDTCRCSVCLQIFNFLHIWFNFICHGQSAKACHATCFGLGCKRVLTFSFIRLGYWDQIKSTPFTRTARHRLARIGLESKSGQTKCKKNEWDEICMYGKEHGLDLFFSTLLAPIPRSKWWIESFTWFMFVIMRTFHITYYVCRVADWERSLEFPFEDTKLSFLSPVQEGDQ